MAALPEMSGTTFHVVSDTHYVHQRDIDASIFTPADILILNGDITDVYNTPVLGDVFKIVTKIYKSIIYVPGNHEYFFTKCHRAPQERDDSFMESVEAGLRHVCEVYNIIYLNNTSIRIGNIEFFGSTMWTSIPADYAPLIYNRVTAYTKIKGCTIETTNKCHATSISAINKFLSAPKSDSMTRVVITHYAPLIDHKVTGKFKEKRDNVAFAAHLPALVVKADWWIFAHTHYNANFLYETTHILSNAFAVRKRASLLPQIFPTK